MGIIITWDYCGFHNKVEFENDEAGKAAAREIWLALHEMPDVANLTPPPKVTQKRRVVRVVFSRGSKPYTYLSKEKVEVGSHVVVYTSDGPQIVTVIDSGEMSDSELEKICPLNKFQYIHGKVVPA